MRLQAAMAQDEKLWKQIRLLQATEEFEAALRRYASLMDENKQNYHILKTIGRPIPGHQHQSAWNRTRSNPKLR